MRMLSYHRGVLATATLIHHSLRQVSEQQEFSSSRISLHLLDFYLRIHLCPTRIIVSNICAAGMYLSLHPA